MPRHPGLACKKRPHPDELHLSSSLPKRLFSISDAAELGGGSAHDAIPPSSTLNTPHESIWNSASSALINSDCITSMHADHSSMSVDAASSKLEGRPDHSSISVDAESSKLEDPGTAHARIPSDGASYHLAYLKSTRDPPLEGKGKGIWTYRSGSSKRDRIESEAELSEVTVEKYAYTLSSGHKADGISGSGKAMHVISRRDVIGLNSKPGMDELWHKGAYGYGDHASRGKQLENSGTLYGAWPRREATYSSRACETGSSCATGDSSMEEIRSNNGFSDISQSVCKEASMASLKNQTTADILVGPRVQERIGCTDYNIIQSSEGVSHTSSIHKAATEEPAPSYVLSSGRLSLEEEAKLGRRAPTIDHDFEEYFSSLML